MFIQICIYIYINTHIQLVSAALFQLSCALTLCLYDSVFFERVLFRFECLFACVSVCLGSCVCVCVCVCIGRWSRGNLLCVVLRVPGLPIRDCAGDCNNRKHTRTQLSAIDVTEKTFFERLYLVLGLGTFGP